MATGYMKALSGGAVKVRSGGSEPSAVRLSAIT